MLVGYARTSTIDQEAGLEAQLRDLKAAHCEEVFHEKLSSVDAERPALEAAIKFVRKDDIFVVTKLDRLARSMRNLIEIQDRLAEKGAALRIMNLGVDTSTSTGKLILTVLGGIAQFEREIMLERQREGIAKAKADGKFRGRKPRAIAVVDEIRSRLANGETATAIAKSLDIGRTSLYRALGSTPDEISAALDRWKK